MPGARIFGHCCHVIQYLDEIKLKQEYFILLSKAFLLKYKRNICGVNAGCSEEQAKCERPPKNISFLTLLIDGSQIFV